MSLYHDPVRAGLITAVYRLYRGPSTVRAAVQSELPAGGDSVCERNWVGVLPEVHPGLGEAASSCSSYFTLIG